MLRVLLAGPPPRPTKVYPDDEPLGPPPVEHAAADVSEQKGEPIAAEGKSLLVPDGERRTLAAEVAETNVPAGGLQPTPLTGAEMREVEEVKEEAKSQIQPPLFVYLPALEPDGIDGVSGQGAAGCCESLTMRLGVWWAATSRSGPLARCCSWIGRIVALFFAAGGMALFFHALETRRICNLYWIAQFGDAASCAQPQYFFADETCGIRSVVALECHHGITGCGPGSMEYQACRAIVEAKYRTHAEADQMTDSDCRNTLITEISVAGGGAIKYLQTKGDADLIKMLPQQLSRPRQPGGIGYMPDLLAQEVLLPLLRCIDVSGNRQLTATPQWWGNIPNLSHLDLSDSGVENLPLSLCSGNAANTITTIDVKFTPASLNVDWHHNPGGSVPRLTSLSNMSLACRDAVRDTVVRLNISHNRFSTIQAMKELDEFSHLTSVDLRYNNITHFAVQWVEEGVSTLPFSSIFQHAIDLNMNNTQKLPCPVLGLDSKSSGNPFETFSFLNIAFPK